MARSLMTDLGDVLALARKHHAAPNNYAAMGAPCLRQRIRIVPCDPGVGTVVGYEFAGVNNSLRHEGSKWP